MAIPKGKHWIEIQKYLPHFNATAKTVRRSYLALRLAYKEVRIVQLHLRLKHPEDDLILLSENVLVNFEDARSTSETAETLFEDAILHYSSTYLAHTGTLLTSLPQELRDLIYRDLILTNHQVDSQGYYKNASTGHINEDGTVTISNHRLSPHYKYPGPGVYAAIEAELRATQLEGLTWLVIRQWTSATCQLHGPESLVGARNRVARGVERLRGLVERPLPAAAEALRKAPTSRIATRVDAHDLELLVEALHPIVYRLVKNGIEATVVVYVGTEDYHQVPPHVFRFNAEDLMWLEDTVLRALSQGFYDRVGELCAYEE